jgi:plastocyanin
MRFLSPRANPLSPPAGARAPALAALVAAAAALIAGPALTAHAQTAAQTWEVQVGSGAADAPPVFEPMAYGPDPLVIRVGDRVVWAPVAGHTVTFTAGQPAPALLVPGSVPGELMLGPGFGPIGVTPGASGVSATFDGSTPVNSGDLTQAFPDTPPVMTVTFTKAGTFGYVCLFHPGMRGSVEVREASQPLPESPAQAKARGQATLGYLASLIQQQAGMISPVDARGLHTAFAGIGNGYGASALAFINGDKTISRGDTVVWTNADPFEIHTVTFTSGGAPPDFIEPRPQPSGPPQLVVPATVVLPSGDTYGGSGVANSGVLSYGSTYALRFDAPAGSYSYLCLLHPWMMGTVTVTG